jgi:diguanylate cyclase (GGDEF)-like protein
MSHARINSRARTDKDCLISNDSPAPAGSSLRSLAWFSPTPLIAAVAIGAALAVSWVPTQLAGGADFVPPLWPLVPILLAARRFGIAGALVGAVLGGLLSGPLTAANVAHATAQQPSDWLLRLGFFLMIAIVAAMLFHSLKREGARSRAAQRTLRELAFRDPLTGLGNRALMEEHLAAALARARRASSAVALMCLDVNDFKLVNDSLGHAAGDELLCDVARRLDGAIRAVDLLARNGGDEFLIMIPDVHADASVPIEATLDTATRVFERITAAMASPFTVANAVFHIEVSAGISIYPRDAGDADALHRHADAAMYAAKSAGAGMLIFDAAHTHDPLESLSKSATLRQALAEGELELHYQPIFRTADARIMGVEALVRWRKPDGELVLPAAFLPVAEQTGLIEELGDFVLSALCAQAVRWRAAGLRPHLGLNVSPRQLRRPGLASHFRAEVARHGLHPSQFVLELTESAWTLEADRMGPVLEQLRAFGFILALDDFGAGYSTLSRLLRLPVDVIKIDRSFLASIPTDAQAAAIVTAILQLAEACRCDVVAEGVETDDQLRFLIARGCSLAQGYRLSRPVPADAATDLLEAKLAESRREPRAAGGRHDLHPVAGGAGGVSSPTGR